MCEPGELLVIRDQYNLALECLTRALSADEAGRRAEAWDLYSQGGQHLTQGLAVHAGGEKHEGAHWETARMLQLKMRDTLRIITTRLHNLEKAEARTECHRGPQEVELPPQLLYPTLEAPSLDVPTLEAPSLEVPTVPRPSLSTATHTTVPLAWASGSVAPPLPVGVPSEQPPAYTPQPTEGHHSLACSADCLGVGLGLGQQTGGEDEEELLFIPQGVQMFLVTPEGTVSAPSYPGYLRVIQVRGQHNNEPNGRPSTFLHENNGELCVCVFQVCDWSFPLTVNTPVLLANSGIFMFPDPATRDPGSYVGIVLPSQLPPGDRDIFQDLLAQLVQLRVQAAEEGAGSGSEGILLNQKLPIGPTEGAAIPMATGEGDKPPLPEWSEKMAQGIRAGCAWLSQGLVKGSEVTRKAVQKGASTLRDHMTPEDTPSEVSPRVTQGLHTARQATGGAVRVSQLLVNGVCTVAGCVGDKLAPHIKKQGAKLIPESMKNTKDGRSNMDGAMAVAASSVQGLSAIWSGLETGAKNVAKSVATETVTTVNYKYGDEAATATYTAVQSTINVGVAALNFDNLGIKGIMKATGKGTAKAMVKDHYVAKEEDAENAEKKRDENEKKK
ncbi:spartin a [Aplochiton taeniatus]